MKKIVNICFIPLAMVLATNPSAAQETLFSENPLIVEMECENALIKETVLSSTRGGIIEYLWENLMTGDTSSASTFAATESGLYALTVLTLPDSLFVRDTLQVIFDAKCCQMQIPSAFTPNNDGRNDLFLPIKPDNCMITDFEMQVFNRWGKLIFQTRNPDDGWDGRDNGQSAPSDVYVYWLKYTAIGNDNEINESTRGDVTLIR